MSRPTSASGLIDVNTFIGGYPWRAVPHPDPEVLVRVLAREGLAGAWVGHLPTAFHRDPAAGNAELFSQLTPHRERLFPVPVVRPDWPDATRTLDEVVQRGAVAVRAYPQLWGMGPGDPSMRWLAEQAAARRLPVVLTVRFEDLRQRHPLDVAGDLPAAFVRELARARTGATLVITAASREMVEEVHWGLTAEERARVYWDISWFWGPPSDECSHLLRTVGARHFLFGSMWPLRLMQFPRANLELLESDVADAPLADASRLTGRGHVA